MTNDMKRVGLIFDTDGVVDFKKSLSTVNSALNENRAQFKLTKSTWDDTTKASEKLKATNEYLTKQYEESTKKVNVLSTELEELEKAENKNEQAISKKKAALATATTSMNNYKNGLDETNAKLKAGTADIEEYAKKIESFGNKAKSAGTSLTKNLTTPIVAVGTAAFAAWTKLDEAYDNIILKTGATGETLDSLTESFDNVYGSMPVESMVVSEAIGEVNTRFKVMGDDLENLSTYMIQFSEITGKDVTDSITQAQKVQGNWNLTVDETKSALGQIAKQSQDTGLSVDVLMDSVNKNSSVFKEMDLSVTESINLLASFEAAGLDGDQMLVGLKKAASNYAKENKSMKDGLSELITNLQNSETAASATQETFDIFGSKAGLAFKTAAQEGRISIDDLSAAMNDYSSVVSDTYNATLDPADQARIAMNNLTLCFAELGDVIQEALGPVFSSLADTLKSITTWFKGLDDSTKTIIVGIGALVAAIGPVLVIIGTLAGAISKIILLYTQFATASAGAGASTGILSGALSSIGAPIIAVTAVIIAVIGALTQLWQTNEGFRESVMSAIASIQEVLTNVWTTVIDPILQSVIRILKDVWENGIQPLWDVWVNFVGDIIMQMLGLWESIQPIVMWFIDFFGPMLTNVFDLVGSIFGSMVTNILQVAGTMLNNLGEIISSVIGVFKGIVDFIINVFTGNWSGAWASIVSIFENIFNGIVAVAKAPINLVIGLINGMVSGIESGINACVRAINTLSFDVPDWVPIIGGETWGFNLDPVGLGRIPYLAKGGDLLSGMAMVAEAGPELLLQKGNRTTVAPLTNGGGATPVDIIDYEKLAYTLVKALKSLAINYNDEVLGNIVDKRILRAVG